ncbi:MAG: fused MFS/spermidine synthase [Planctomycetes bacterium]|nr:fused MFS/spermidine synthase [Planctomycetota bacterium]
MPTTIGIDMFDEDGRVFLARKHREWINRDRTGGGYDIIYVDALSGYQVPFQLTTVEFVRVCRDQLNANGAYLLEMIDIYASGQFLGSMVKTLREVFPYVYVFAEPLASADWKLYRKPFVVAAFNQPFIVDNLGTEYVGSYQIVALTKEEIDGLLARPDSFVLTDEFAPIENMLAPVVRQSALDRAIMDWLVEINRHVFVGDHAEAVRLCDRALSNDWRHSDRAQLLGRKADSLLRLRRFAEAESAARESLKLSGDDPTALKALARSLVALGRAAVAPPLFERVLELDPADGCRFDLVLALQGLNRHEEAAQHCSILVSNAPDIPDGYVRWAISLEELGRIDEARKKVSEALKRDPNNAAARTVGERLGP